MTPDLLTIGMWVCGIVLVGCFLAWAVKGSTDRSNQD